MLIPSIDLQGGRIVQLVQGERLAVETSDIDGWIQRFAGYPKVQLIDLDAAKNAGANESLIATICARLPCRVGGGIRTPERAQALVALGATGVILASSLFRNGAVDVEFAERVSEAVTPDRFIAAVDAVRALEPFCGEFLYTHVDKEGLMQGTDVDAILAVRRATTRRVTAAGGITTWDEIDRLDALQVEAVVGMAVYTGQLPLDRLR